MRKTALWLAVAILPAARSSPLVCNFAGPGASVEISQLFTDSGLAIALDGFDDAPLTPGLYRKNDLSEKSNPNEENGVGDELGLGFLGTIDHEIELNRYLQLTRQSPWQNPGTVDSWNEPVSFEAAPAGENDESFGPNTLEIQSGSLDATADHLTSSEETNGYNSTPVSNDDADLSPLPGSHAFPWELGALLASALIGLWLFLRGVLLTMRPPARHVRHVRA